MYFPPSFSPDFEVLPLQTDVLIIVNALADNPFIIIMFSLITEFALRSVMFSVNCQLERL